MAVRLEKGTSLGNPQHYGIELPQRCLALLDGLWGSASDIYLERRRHLGPLTSTFLISMSMPIINIPTEQIEKHIGRRDAEGYVDDRHLNPAAVKEFEKVLKQGKFGKTPFFRSGAWRFYKYEGQPLDLASGLPDTIAAELQKDEAGELAAARCSSIFAEVHDALHGRWLRSEHQIARGEMISRTGAHSRRAGAPRDIRQHM